MKKTLKLTTPLVVALPIISVVSCGTEHGTPGFQGAIDATNQINDYIKTIKDAADVIATNKMKELNTLASSHKASEFIDVYIGHLFDKTKLVGSMSAANINEQFKQNKLDNEDYFLNHHTTYSYGYTWSDISQITHEDDFEFFKHTFDASEYSVDKLKADFSAIDNTHITEVNKFIDNYFKGYKYANYTAYKSKTFNKVTGTNAAVSDKVVVSFSNKPFMSTPFGLAYNLSNLTKKPGASNDAGADKLDFYTDHIDFFGARKYFNPNHVVLSLKDKKIDDLTKLLDGSAKEVKYKSAYNSGVDENKNYVALKMLTGNMNLTPSELFSVTSRAFVKINSMKTSALIEAETQKNRSIYLEGSHNGAKDMISSLLMNPSTVKQVQGVYAKHLSLHDSIFKSDSWDGWRTVIDDAGMPNSIPSFDISKNYLYAKYGFMDTIKAAFNDNEFKTNFQTKVQIYNMADRKFNSISNHEHDFIVENKINLLDTTVQESEHFRKMLGLKLEDQKTYQEFYVPPAINFDAM